MTFEKSTSKLVSNLERFEFQNLKAWSTPYEGRSLHQHVVGASYVRPATQPKRQFHLRANLVAALSPWIATTGTKPCSS